MEKKREVKGGRKEIGKEGQREKYYVNESNGNPPGCWRLTYLAR